MAPEVVDTATPKVVVQTPRPSPLLASRDFRWARVLLFVRPMDGIGGGWAQAPAGTNEAVRAFRGAILAGAASAFLLFLLVGPPPRRSYGVEAAARPVEIDAAVAAWIAEAEREPEGGRLWGRPAKAPPAAPHRPADAAPVGSGGTAPTAGRLDLNHATAGEIDAAVPGFGRVLSERLVAARPSAGWKDWAEVEGVDGIGRRRIESLRLHAHL